MALLRLFSAVFVVASSVSITFSEGATKYKVLVTTGSQARPAFSDGPSTNADLFLELYGIDVSTGQSSQGSKKHKLSPSFSLMSKAFATGKTKQFEVKDDVNLRDLSQIKIARGSTIRGGPDWLCQKVVVTTQDGKEYTFNGDFWLTEQDFYYRIPVNSAPVSYTVEVITGTETKLVDAAGTDADVTVILLGVSKATNAPDETNPIELYGQTKKNLYETGQTDILTVKDTIDVVKLNKIRVKRSSVNLDPTADWYLKEIKVTVPDGSKYVFTANKWLDEADKYLELPVSPSKTYDIITYTSSASEASSSASVYITLLGSLGKSDEIHLKSSTGENTFTSSSSKVFQVNFPGDLGKIQKINVRLDATAPGARRFSRAVVEKPTPNWKVDKILVVVDNDVVSEFLILDWFNPGETKEKTVTSEFPGTSIKLDSFTPCVHPEGSKIHPEPRTKIVLENSCSLLTTLFRLMPNGAVTHLASGMCLQRDGTGDPKTMANGATLLLGRECTLYTAGSATAHALPFAFTDKPGSLKEQNSGKCLTASGGVMKTPLTLTDTCDTNVNKLSFIDKRGNVILPDKKKEPEKPKVSKAPAKKPAEEPKVEPAGSKPTKAKAGGSPVGTTSPSSTPTNSSGTNSSTQFPYNPQLPPNFCSSGCPQTCQPSCMSTCCSGNPTYPQQQYPASRYPPMLPTYPQPTPCPSYCTPANCRSDCHIYCCTPKLDLAARLNNKEHRPRGQRWD